MNTIIIVSNKKQSEIERFGITQFNNFFGILSDNDCRTIIIVDNSIAETDLASAMDVCNRIATPKVLLFHGPFVGYNDVITNVGTRGNANDTEERTKYNILLNANFAGNIDTEDKKKAFDTTWEYFSKDRLDRIKTDFLYHIYNGGKPSTFKEKGEIPNIQTFEKLYESFEKDGGQYNKQLDIGDDETEGADQRQKLSLLRDALLANK